MSLNIDIIRPQDLDELETLARPHEERLHQRFPSLPIPDTSALRRSLEKRLEGGTGVVARENGEAVGCLSVIGPIPDFRPNVSGAFAPLFSCLVDGPKRDRVFTSMLTELGRIPGLGDLEILALTCPIDNVALNTSLGQNGFGIRCADAVVGIADLPATAPETGFELEDIPWRDAVVLVEVKDSLARHLASSPMFMEYFDFSPEFVAWKSEQRQSVHIVARDGARIVGYIEATFDGENYLTRSPHMRNICGAGVLPEYRNRGIMQSLLVQLANRYRAEGVTTLGVDYETLNPNARGFWELYFKPYTWSWERRFDQRWGHG